MIAAIAVPAEHDLRHRARARARARPLRRARPAERRRRPAARALAGRRRPRARPALRRAAAGSAASRTTASRSSSRCRGWCSRRSSSRCRSSCARSCRCCARSAPSRSRRPRRSAPRPFQVFRRVTLPAIRWAVAYGVVLTTARAIGEFGAVSVVSGNIEGKTADADALRAGAVRRLRHRRRVRGLGRARADRDRHGRRCCRVFQPKRSSSMGITVVDVTKRSATSPRSTTSRSRSPRAR